ncbi:hypothetical protein NIES2119_18440 [[Phormidium ambiguum] IAM M-71]|uniref:Uncharacterized protein n=1 Tax=[Phormidium ambiguum] IAM M-71 TaxID=454136 RepID=A0A1U7IG69_9CYAN|nr:hypothetical protein [Phormidium ambiguum]OKH35979.1 hypothetical protein NIES2119_18440 [Phormidium ambiguum IAM M-71]
MNNQPHIPDAETAKRLLANLRRSRLAMEAATLELENLTMQLENDNRQRRLVRLKQAIKNAEVG